MSTRVNISEMEPNAYKAMFGLETYLKSSSLSSAHIELVKIRASQVNGCAFCIDMHTRDAMKNGETAQRIFLLNAWRETNLFSKEERIILAMTEEITLVNQGGLSDETYNQAEQEFGKSYVAQLIIAIVTINGWNRIAISTRMQPAGQ